MEAMYLAYEQLLVGRMPRPIGRLGRSLADERPGRHQEDDQGVHSRPVNALLISLHFSPQSS